MRTLAWWGTIALGVVVAACSNPTPESTAATPIPSPRALAPPVVSIARAELPPPLQATIPEADKRVALEFAVGHRTISSEWDQFQAVFDEWREGLVACDASSVDVALARFAGDFVAITEAARGLPRDRILREIADLSVSATEREEGALRQLRDNWHPGDPTFFEGVNVARASAAALRKQVEDGLSDLQRRTSSASQDLVSEFSAAFRQIDSTWDEFDRRYDSFRTDEPQATSAETVSGLNQLVDEFRGIVGAVRKLPTSEVTRQVASTLARAADDEELALRKLRGSFEKSEGAAEAGPAEAPPEAPSEGAPPGPPPEPPPEGAVEEPQVGSEGQMSEKDETVFVQRDRSLFDAFDAQLIASNSLRREVSQALIGVAEDGSEANRAAAADFTGQYAALARKWDAFHQGYDVWRVNEGGCDRAEVVATLGGFVLQFGELALGVRSLPGAAFLQPMGELFVEAAEGEEEAVRGLRSSWRPFDGAVFHTLDQERIEAQRLRRQVATGLRDLLARYGITPQDVERASPSSP